MMVGKAGLLHQIVSSLKGLSSKVWIKGGVV